MSEEIAPYEIFIVLPTKLNTSDPLTIEEWATLEAATAFLDKMSPAVRQMYEVAMAKCAELGWQNLPAKYLYTARIAVASVEPYSQQLIEQFRETSAHIKGNG
jgi:hypothetical protein